MLDLQYEAVKPGCRNQGASQVCGACWFLPSHAASILEAKSTAYEAPRLSWVLCAASPERAHDAAHWSTMIASTGNKNSTTTGTTTKCPEAINPGATLAPNKTRATHTRIFWLLSSGPVWIVGGGMGPNPPQLIMLAVSGLLGRILV